MTSVFWTAAATCGLGLLVFALGGACGGQDAKGPASPDASADGSSGSGSGSGSSGGSSSGGSSGAGSGSSSGAGFGCQNGFTTTPSPVDPSRCVAQLASTTACMGSPCSWMVELPCVDDAGAGDAAGAGEDCMAWCNGAAPSGAGPAGICSVIPLDGGASLAQCGACGI